MEDSQPQPDFLAMAADMNAAATDMHRVAHAHTSIATNIEKSIIDSIRCKFARSVVITLQGYPTDFSDLVNTVQLRGTPTDM